ncbi:MAG: hypothetical protein HN931_01985 [Desulfobacterales bacterium]|jgi:hypothetical protein|nr:hypothetical protein [Desulfobacteraceae bacterium]MBT7084928.1 hypothetical protein [Desulfobacterales bacterium]
MNDKKKFIKIIILDNIIEAQIIGSILEERGIPHQIKSYHDTAYDGLFQLQKGWGVIYAQETNKSEIIETINIIRSDQ